MTIKSITDWADRKINEQTDNSLFLNLSMARTTNKIVELLWDSIVWKYNDKDIRTLLLSYYREYLNNNLSSWFNIEKELLEYFYLLEYNNSNESVEDFLYCLSDDLSLRKEGYNGVLIMPDYLIKNLQEFKDYPKLIELLKTQELTGYEI